MDLGLTSKKVFITGSTSGIGRAIAKAFLAEGAEVFIHGLTDNEVTETIKELQNEGKVIGVQADLSSPDGVRASIDFISRNGSLDILINNAGIFGVKKFDQLTDDDWLNTFNLNLFSVSRLSQYFLPKMIERGEGAIINIASEAGVKPLPQMVHYSVSKTALIGLTRGMAELTKGTRVRVNSVLPGPTWTEGVMKYFDGLQKADGRPLSDIVSDYFLREEPTSLIQRFVKPEEVARLVVFTAANEAMNGGAYRVEGGIIRSIL